MAPVSGVLIFSSKGQRSRSQDVKISKICRRVYLPQHRQIKHDAVITVSVPLLGLIHCQHLRRATTRQLEWRMYALQLHVCVCVVCVANTHVGGLCSIFWATRQTAAFSLLLLLCLHSAGIILVLPCLKGIFLGLLEPLDQFPPEKTG